MRTLASGACFWYPTAVQIKTLRRKEFVLVLLALALGLYGCTQKAPGDSPPANTPTPNPPKVDVKLDGKLLFSKEQGIWSWSGGSSKRLTKDGSLQQPAWSPDGKKIAYVKMEGNYSDIWVMGSSANDPVNLTRFGRSGSNTWAFAPRWSPDGSQIAFLSDLNTYDLALWLMKPDGSGRRQVSFMNDYLGGIDGPAWRPKGDSITFSAYRSGKSQIWTMTLANGRWQQHTDMGGGAYDPQWSPSGDALAFTGRGEGSKSDIWVMAMPDGAPQRATTNSVPQQATADGAPQRATTDGVSRSPAWSPDGKSVAYLSGQGGKFDFWVIAVEKAPEGATLRLSAPKRVTQGLDPDPAGGLSWTR